MKAMSDQERAGGWSFNRDMVTTNEGRRNDNDFSLSIDDPERDGRIIRQNFFRELCERDRDAIRNGQSNIFTIEEIRRRSLGAFTLGLIRSHIRGYADEEEPQLEFVGHIDDDRIRLTEEVGM